jgi:hypothetical protein
LSFWAKASSATSALQVVINQNFGSGGSSEVSALPNTSYSLTTSWQRFTFTATFPSISGKTIGTNSFLDVRLALGSSTINSINVDYWGVQLEYGSKATPFQTASGGSPQGELAMCQRYFTKSYELTDAPASVTTVASIVFPQGLATVHTGYYFSVAFKQTMRSAPTVNVYSYNGAANRVTEIATGTDKGATSAVANSSYIGQTGFSMYNQSGVTVTFTAGGIIHYTASAEL